MCNFCFDRYCQIALLKAALSGTPTAVCNEDGRLFPHALAGTRFLGYQLMGEMVNLHCSFS